MLMTVHGSESLFYWFIVLALALPWHCDSFRCLWSRISCTCTLSYPKVWILVFHRPSRWLTYNPLFTAAEHSLSPRYSMYPNASLHWMLSAFHTIFVQSSFPWTARVACCQCSGWGWDGNMGETGPLLCQLSPGGWVQVARECSWCVGSLEGLGSWWDSGPRE